MAKGCIRSRMIFWSTNIAYRNTLCIHPVTRLHLDVTVTLALRRHLRVSNTISAVVVDGVFLADPAEPPVLKAVQILELLLVPPPLALGCTKLGLHRRFTAVHVEAPVGCDEWGLGPVRLLKPAPRGPIVGVPETRVYLHWLVEWEFHPQVLAVLEHPDWHIVHEESAHVSQCKCIKYYINTV